MNKRIALIFLLVVCNCARQETAPPIEAPEMLSRTEFTDRIENFFEYAPLKANQPSQFLIHLTDLSDGSPLEEAEVVLIARPKTGGAVSARTTAKVGRVTGIYVAELTPTSSGEHDLEFHIRNSRVDERMPLSGFEVE